MYEIDEKMLEISEFIYKNNFKAKKNDSVLIISDNEQIAKNLAIKAKELGLLPEKILYNGSQRPIKGISKGLIKYLNESQIVLTPLKRYDEEFNFRFAVRYHATKVGNARMASMVGVNETIFTHNAMLKKPKDMAPIAYRLSRILSKGHNVKITTEMRTNLSLNIGGWNRTSEPSIGELFWNNTTGNIPCGETYVAPVEGRANGKLVVDGSIPHVPILKENVVIHFKNGKITQIRGGENALLFRKNLGRIMSKEKDNKRRESCRFLGELGIGLNDLAEIMGTPIIDEKVNKTAHIGIGGNKLLGGIIEAPLHNDLVFKNPTIEVDNEIIVESGKILKSKIKKLCLENFLNYEIPNWNSNRMIRLNLEPGVAKDINNKLYRVYVSPSGNIRKCMVGNQKTSNLVSKIWKLLKIKKDYTIIEISKSIGMKIDNTKKLIRIMDKYDLIDWNSL